MITPDEVDGVLRLAKVVQQYEQLIAFMLDENYYLSRADIQRDGFTKSMRQLKAKIVHDALDDAAGSSAKASRAIGLSEGAIASYRFRQKEPGA